MGLKQLSGIVMDVDLTHPHDGVLLSLENKLTPHTMINIGTAVLDFTGRILQSIPRLASSFASMIVASARLLGKVLEFSDLPTSISPMLIFLSFQSELVRGKMEFASSCLGLSGAAYAALSIEGAIPDREGESGRDATSSPSWR